MSGLGEVRDGAALTLLKAWNTGHPGGIGFAEGGGGLSVGPIGVQLAIKFALNRLDEARADFERAASLTQNTRERELLLSRAAACTRDAGPER